MLVKALYQTLYMVSMSALISSWRNALVLCWITNDSIAQNRTLNAILAFLVNTTRSVPCDTLVVMIPQVCDGSSAPPPQ